MWRNITEKEKSVNHGTKELSTQINNIMKKYLCLSICLLVNVFTSTAQINFHDATNGYSQSVTVAANGVKTIYISGQVGEGETLELQMKNALNNLKAQLNKHGADFKNIVKMNSFIVDYKPSDLVVFRGVRQEIFGDKIAPASTLVGVQALALPQWKIEIDAVAVILQKAE